MKIIPIVLLVLAGAVCGQTPTPKTKTYIYIAPKEGVAANVHCDPKVTNCSARGGSVDYTLKATEALMSRCPDLITVTSKPDVADFSLRLQTGDSVLYDKAGNAVYVSHARNKLSNFAKDICGYVAKTK
jgi:hypothetical protein